MATSYTTKAKLGIPSTGDRTWDVAMDANLSDLDGIAPLTGLMVTPHESPASTSLNVDVSAGQFVKSSTSSLVTVVAATLTCTASVLNYIYAIEDGSLHVNATGFPGSGPYLPLATVVAGATAITSITDLRTSLASVAAPSISATATQTAHFVLSGPVSGAAAAPTFRALVAADIPALPESGITGLVTDLAAKAPLASPPLTGTPSAPTATGGTNTTQIATTAFVTAAIAASLSSGSTPTVAAGAGAGTGPTISIIGTDRGGYITITPGTIPSASSTVATISFGGTWAASPNAVVIGAGSTNVMGVDLAAPPSGYSTAGWTLTVGTVALAAGTYIITYAVV